jgi:hypothetical protein
LESEDKLGVNPADVARISRIALQALSETHVIIPKEEFKTLLEDHTTESNAVIWQLVLECYRNAAVQMAQAVRPDVHKGFMVGLNLLERMHNVYLEENETLFDENTNENSTKTV